jgi:hypothetical protein
MPRARSCHEELAHRCVKYRRRVNTWFEYRAVWAAHPWVLVYAILAVALVVVSVVATVVGGVFAVLFVPALAAIYIHHLIVMKKAD